MELLFQNNSYRVVYAPQPSRSHSDWGFTRRIKESQTLSERWECLVCTRTKSLSVLRTWQGVCYLFKACCPVALVMLSDCCWNMPTFRCACFIES